MHRFLTVMSLAGALTMALPASIASGTPPSRAPLPDFDVTFQAGEVCDFSVRVRSVENRGIQTTFYDSDGNVSRIAFNGRLTVAITNLGSGASVTRNLSGPGVLEFTPDGGLLVEQNGPWPFILSPAFDAPFVINRGRVVIEFPASGAPVVHHRSGTAEDVCATLS